jgi:hypothetical protein
VRAWIDHPALELGRCPAAGRVRHRRGGGFPLDECLLRAVVPGFALPPWADLTDWPALARAAGEEVDPEGWRRWAAERFPDPGPEP